MNKSVTRCCVLVLGFAGFGTACAPEGTEPANTGGTSTGGSATGGTVVSTGGKATGGTASGGRASGGQNTGGRNTGGTSTATGGTTSTCAGTASPCPPTAANSIAYIGCSMANNIGTGYKRVGGTIMWNADNYQTGAMVVQNWTNSSSSSWQLFDQKMNSIGGKNVVKAIMVQICILSSGATDAEVKSMIAAARAHTNAGTHIYLVGQPQYEAGHTCSIAGGKEASTDEQARRLAADSSVNQDLTYLGVFRLDSTKGEVMSDSCHASSPTGENVLGNQAKAFWGG